jgi:hypothetical protein
VQAPTIDTDYVQLGAVDAISPTDVWAVGYFLDRDLGVFRTLAAHYDGRRWKLLRTPNIGTVDNQLFDLVAVNANNIWAVGKAGDGTEFRTLAMQFTGDGWHVRRTPDRGPGQTSLNGVAVGAGGNPWAVGSYNDANGLARTLTESYRDGRWFVVNSPNATEEDNELWSVAISSGGDVWAVGDSNPHSVGQTLVEHLCR